ncbi:hypothetical protein DEO72_LG5g897 [Vigna unguiculata]|uniref:Uncharacterized protein n=1 Tax=Vigna unguiculata TaxID=3917 RepID=A0A4D6LWU1_VIGUN|nr:hypothetical protein DEO72_LG5g897 [Vigna unguiculata]
MHCNRKKNGCYLQDSPATPKPVVPPTVRAPRRPESSTAGAAPNRAPHSRGSKTLATKMEATIRKKIMGKDELKAWFIARATKPLPCFSNSSHRIPNSNSSHRKRYWKEAVTATIGSGIATAVAAAIGGNSSGDFNNAFGEEESRFAVGDGADTGRRPLRRRLQLARRRFRVAVMAQREWRVLTAFWRRRLSRNGGKGFQCNPSPFHGGLWLGGGSY